MVTHKEGIIGLTEQIEHTPISTGLGYIQPTDGHTTIIELSASPILFKY
ncbi:MAG: hypothetical protein GXY98_06985 [Erysipelothrix sp.]|nr:hypothetical protein [Erysipelothrix sp.]